MGQVIRISDELYKKLESHAKGFDTPANVIEKLLVYYEKTGLDKALNKNKNEKTSTADSLEIVNFPTDEKAFKNALLIKKRAFIKLHKTDGSTQIREWNAANFTRSSILSTNLRSGFLRDWSKKGIYKAVLSLNREDIT